MIDPPGPDSLGFYAAAARIPEQTEAAVLAVQDAALPDGQGVEAVVLTGEGAAGWSAEVVAAIAGRSASVPVLAARPGEVPAFVAAEGDSALVMRLEGDAVHVGDVRVPLGIDVPHPRAALGALCAAPLAVLGQLGIVDGVEVEIDRAVAQLHRRRSDLFAAGAPSLDVAKLARRVGRLVPLVYGEGAVGRLAAARWKQQCNVNAKVPAFAYSLPELAHDEVAGWGQHGDLTRQVFCAIVLRHGHEFADADARFARLDEVLSESVSTVQHVEASGEGPLAQLLDLAFIGDVLSLHLAFQEQLDPGPAPALDLLL